MPEIKIKMSKSQEASWGFRVQGGKDFSSPLTVQKVNVGSVAEQAGLQAGDVIVKLASADMFHLRHKEAMEAIVKAGNEFELVIDRGSQIWAQKEAKKEATPPPPPVKKPVPTQMQLRKGKHAPLVTNEDEIAEIISAQAEVLANGMLGVNFKKFEKEVVIQKDSPTYRLLHGEIEEKPPRRLLA